MNFTDEIRYKNTLWYNNSGALLPLTLPHQTIELPDDDAIQLLKQTNAYLIRWHEGFDSGMPTNWWHIINDTCREFSDYRKNDRFKIKRGLIDCKTRLLSKEEISTKNLYPVYKNAYQRFKTFEKKTNVENFEVKLNRLISDHEFYGVFYKGELSGFSINFCKENACFFRYIYFDPQHLPIYTSYVFFYGICRHYLNDRKFRYVTDGARSISHQTKIHEFLENKFGFRKAYCKLRIRYRRDVNAGVEILFHFRRILRKINNPVIRKLNVVLFQEEINREIRK